MAARKKNLGTGVESGPRATLPQQAWRASKGQPDPRQPDRHRCTTHMMPLDVKYTLLFPTAKGGGETGHICGTHQKAIWFTPLIHRCYGPVFSQLVLPPELPATTPPAPCLRSQACDWFFSSSHRSNLGQFTPATPWKPGSCQRG